MSFLFYMNSSLLTYKNFKKLPNELIYKMPYDGTNVYKMADVKTGKYVGKMIGNIEQESMASQYYPSFESYDSFKIHFLLIKERGQGYGTKFINFAKNESKKYGGKGKVHLIASGCYTPDKPPHVFYRKLGFSSQYEEVIAKIDNAIKKHKPLSWHETVDIPMYLEEKSNLTKKSSIWTKLKNLFK